ncbi:MAG: ABC transporter permease [Candidatus Coatesbacteria bacterium]|nr:MAG: ABC transporter permease [Candidatus Coatesbacteria bacterium]
MLDILLAWFEGIGKRTLRFLGNMGGITLMFYRAFINIFLPPFGIKRTFKQMLVFGVESIPVVALTAVFTGMVLALQTTYEISKFGAENYIGGVVGLSMTRELGPVLTSLIVAGRVGASIAAEIGTMKVTEQIDALETLAMNPIRYLVVPRLIAGITMLPLLCALADFIGIGGGFAVSVYTYDIPSRFYMDSFKDIVGAYDLFVGLLKTIVFGAIIACVACYYGFKTSGGAEGVGRATTIAVVSSCIIILLADVLLTALFVG